jgi:hypothetical protein
LIVALIIDHKGKTRLLNRNLTSIGIQNIVDGVPGVFNLLDKGKRIFVNDSAEEQGLPINWVATSMVYGDDNPEYFVRGTVVLAGVEESRELDA